MAGPSKRTAATCNLLSGLCLFFREQIKNNSKAFSILVAQTLADAKQAISSLQNVPAPTQAEADKWLGDRIASIQAWLSGEFQEIKHEIEYVGEQVEGVQSLQRVLSDKLDKQDSLQSKALRADLRAKLTRAEELHARDEGKEAVALMEEVYHAAKSHGLSQLQLEVTMHLGLNESAQHDFKTIERRLREAEKLIKDVKHPWHQIQYYRLKSKVLRYQKHAKPAEKVLQKAIALSDSDDEDVVQVGLLARASYIHLLCDQKRSNEADGHLVYIRSIVEEKEGNYSIALVAELLEACIHWAISKADINHINAFVQIALRQGQGRQEAICISHTLHDCANGARGMKATDAAVICADAAERLGYVAQRPDIACAAAYTAAGALAENEDFRAARERCIRLADASKSLGEPVLRFCIFRLLSQTSRQLGDRTTAVEAAEAALRDTEGDSTALCLSKMTLAEALLDCGRVKEATEHARAAHQSSEHCDLPPEWVEQSLVLIADCAARLGDWATAENCAAQLGKCPSATRRSIERQKIIENRVQMYKRVREGLTSVIETCAPLSVARTEGADSVQAANAMLMKSVIDAWKQYPNAAAAIYDYWGRGNLLRAMLNMRAFPGAFNMTLEVHTLQEARQAVRLWALIADVLVLIWKGPTVSSHVVCPIPSSFSNAGGGGYFVGLCKGEPLVASAVTGLGGHTFSRQGWKKDSVDDKSTPIMLTKFASLLPSEVGRFLCDEVSHLISLGRLIVVPATGICSVNFGHGPLESLFAEACNAMPAIKGDAATFPASWVPYFPDIPLNALAEVVQEHDVSLSRLRLLLFRKTRLFRSGGITGTEAKELELEMQDSLAQIGDMQAGLRRRYGWGEAREAVFSRYDGFSEQAMGPILVLQNMGYRWRIEHGAGESSPEPQVLPKSDEPMGTWLQPPDTRPEFLNTDHLANIERAKKRQGR